MTQRQLMVHLCIPALLALGVFAAALRRQPLGIEMLAAYVLGSYFFYAAPYLLWAVVATLAKFSGAMWHAGFIASSLALVAIASSWLHTPDLSGLPLQWMLYWPLAVVLQVVTAGIIAIYRGVTRMRNPSIGTGAAR